MGFIKAFTGALSGAFADQWKDYYKPSSVASTVGFYPAIEQGQNNGIGENTKGSSNVITNGSKILVPTGTALITIQDGAITGCITEPGGYIYSSNAPESKSLFNNDGILASTIGQSWEKFKFGGQPSTEQLAFYVNLQEITGNTFGTPTPISWDDKFLQTQVSAAIRGTYAIKITDPILFVNEFVPIEFKVADARVFNFSDSTNEKAESLFSDVIQCLPQAFGLYCQDANGGARLSDMQRNPIGISKALSETIESQFNWQAKYGFSITKVSILALEYDAESAELVKQAQADDVELRKATRMGQAYSNNMAGMMAAASASAMNAAASNESGAMTGFMGMNIANMQANNLMGAATTAAQTAQPSQPVEEDPYEKLTKMKTLLDNGVITQADFDAAKAKLLGL